MGKSPFTDVTKSAGIRFHHEHGGKSPLNILQTAGSGCAFFDYDGDGWQDIYLVNCQGPSALYRNDGKGAFNDVTEEAGVANSGHFGMGCAVGDYDGDGDLDLYATNYGPNVLYRNNGNRTFTDVTKNAKVAAGGWSTSAAFADYDGDGDLDLYVTRYVVFDENSKQLCTIRGVQMACAPIEYPAQSGILYRNNGNGTFDDVTLEAHVTNPDGRGFGVVWGDFDQDGDPDLYVANDAGANNLFDNLGNGHFRDVGMLRGVAYGEDGSAEGSMGVDCGDYDNDGDFDFIVTNFQNETDALYRNNGSKGFSYSSFAAGIGEPSLLTLSFGVGFFDFDNDGWLDIFVANGHVQDTIHQLDTDCEFAQKRQIFKNTGRGKFEDITAQCGPAITLPAVSRGAAFGDYDNDGDTDILVNNNGQSPMLLRNDVGNKQNWLTVRLVGNAPNRFAVGSRVTVKSGDKMLLREVRAGYSYASSSDFRVHFGMGNDTIIEAVTVHWRDGTQTIRRDVRANQELIIRQDR